MATQRTIVAVVDDDFAMRKAMATLLSAIGYCTELFASGEAFLDAAMRSEASCLIVDIQLGDISGVELGRQLATTGFIIPIIFMTAADDETLRSGATQLVPLHSDYDSFSVWGYARPILARALSVVNIHLMRARAAFRCRSQAAISRRSRLGSSILRSRHWPRRTPISISTMLSQLACLGV